MISMSMQTSRVLEAVDLLEKHGLSALRLAQTVHAIMEIAADRN